MSEDANVNEDYVAYLNDFWNMISRLDEPVQAVVERHFDQTGKMTSTEYGQFVADMIIASNSFGSFQANYMKFKRVDSENYPDADTADRVQAEAEAENYFRVFVEGMNFLKQQMIRDRESG